MKLLLDTHVWIWALLDPKRLGDKTADELTDPKADVWLSPISIWETSLLIERGRVKVDRSPREWIEGALREFPVREAELTHSVALASRELQIQTQDPADRFIAASAHVYDLVLVTSDEHLRAGSGYRSMPG